MLFYTACSSRVFSGAEENAPVETVSEDDSQEERERKEKIPQRKADISRCWSKYCMDVLRASRDKCVQELMSTEQSDEDQDTEKGQRITFFITPVNDSNIQYKSCKISLPHPSSPYFFHTFVTAALRRIGFFSLPFSWPTVP